MDVTTLTAIIGAISLVMGGIITGFWQWMNSKRKTEAEAMSTAQASLMAGFVLLIDQFKVERLSLVQRINELEANNMSQDRRIILLERLISKNNIDIPDTPV